MRYWTSDQHFGHHNIIKYSNRPYSDPNYTDVFYTLQMNSDLVARYNAIVTDTDDVWMLGDLALGHTTKNLLYVAKCAGNKTFLTGNHDKNFRKNGTVKSGWDKKYAKYCDFDQVLHGTQQVTLSNGQNVLVSHFPYRGDARNNERYLDHRPQDDGTSWLLHGHVHEKWRQRGRMINVGVDAWAGQPVSENDIIELISAGENDLPPLTWEY